MLALFGETAGRAARTSAARPRVILMLGLQGSGKTTTTGKLGRWLAKQGRHPLMVSTDVRRPAAIEQLSVVGKQAGVRVHDPAGELDPVRARAGRSPRRAMAASTWSSSTRPAGCTSTTS
jgi:signal recognition particle subunit SRP54